MTRIELLLDQICVIWNQQLIIIKLKDQNDKSCNIYKKPKLTKEKTINAKMTNVTNIGS